MRQRAPKGSCSAKMQFHLHFHELYYPLFMQNQDRNKKRKFDNRRPGKPAGKFFNNRSKHGAQPQRSFGKKFVKPAVPAQKAPAKPESSQSWGHVVSWYDKLVGDRGSDYQKNLVLPAALKMLSPKPGQKILDLCCGQGVFSRCLAGAGVGQIVAVDISDAMIQAAKLWGENPNINYVVGDARNLGDLADSTFDAVACLLSLHDLDNIEAVFANVAKALKPGGLAVSIIMHPCFRIPRQSSWGWDEKLKIQYRRLDRYMTQMNIPIATHPGSAPTEHTQFFHRPLSAYINAMGKAGLSTTECEELISHHSSQPGPRCRAENRSRQEFPVFLAIKALKIA